MRYLGLCCIVKDESPFLEEWIAFHTLMGVEGFVIYDNESAEPVQHTLRRLMRKQFISVIPTPGKAQQIPAYDHCLEHFGDEFAWMGFLDMDEFAVPVKHGDLRLMLSLYEAAAGLGINWMHFGSGGHTTRPGGLQIENYTMSMPGREPNVWHVKLFVQPKKIRHFINPHLALAAGQHRIVNTAGERLLTPLSYPPRWDVGQINHYHYRSKQDYYEKLKRGMADSKKFRDIPERLDPPFGDVEDLKAARHAPAVRKLLERDEACAVFAERMPVPVSPSLAMDEFARCLKEGLPGEALILLAKARRLFPDHPDLEALAREAEKLLADD